MSRRRVLAISRDLDQLRRIVASLERVGAKADAVESVDALAKMVPHRTIVIAVEADHRGDLQALAARLPEQAEVVVVVEEPCTSSMTELMGDSRVNHLVADRDLERAVPITVTKILTGDIFGLEKYLPEGTDVQYRRIRDFDGRVAVTKEIIGFAAKNKIRRQTRDSIAQVCEELLMNALYDAPINEDGSLVFGDVPPRERIKQRSPRPVSVRFAATEEAFVLAVRDRFGRLSKDTLLAYLRKCTQSAEQIDGKTLGAGLGLYLVVSSVAKLVINVARGLTTEVVCSFDRGGGSPLRLASVFVYPDEIEFTDTGERDRPPVEGV